jgi:hypothetical protein
MTGFGDRDLMALGYDAVILSDHVDVQSTARSMIVRALTTYLCPLPDGYWAIQVRGTGITCYQGRSYSAEASFSSSHWLHK